MMPFALLISSMVFAGTAKQTVYRGHLTTEKGIPTKLKVEEPSSMGRATICLDVTHANLKKNRIISGLYVEVKGAKNKDPKGCFRVDEIKISVYDPARTGGKIPKK